MGIGLEKRAYSDCQLHGAQSHLYCRPHTKKKQIWANKKKQPGIWHTHRLRDSREHAHACARCEGRAAKPRGTREPAWEKTRDCTSFLTKTNHPALWCQSIFIWLTGIVMTFRFQWAVTEPSLRNLRWTEVFLKPRFFCMTDCVISGVNYRVALNMFKFLTWWVLGRIPWVWSPLPEKSLML